jgi:hypothetical protein
MQTLFIQRKMCVQAERTRVDGEVVPISEYVVQSRKRPNVLSGIHFSRWVTRDSHILPPVDVINRFESTHPRISAEGNFHGGELISKQPQTRQIGGILGLCLRTTTTERYKSD